MSADTECAICKQTLFRPATLACQHNFCYECINRIPNQQCPMCRTMFLAPIGYNKVLDELVKVADPSGYQLSGNDVLEHDYAIDAARREVLNDILTREIPQRVIWVREDLDLRVEVMNYRRTLTKHAIFCFLNSVVLLIAGLNIINTYVLYALSLWIALNFCYLFMCLINKDRIMLRSTDNTI